MTDIQSALSSQLSKFIEKNHYPGAVLRYLFI